MCWNESPSFSVLKHWSLINPSQNFWIEKVILFSTVLWIFFHWLSGRIQVFCKKTFTFLKMRKFWRKFIVSFPLIFLKYSLKDWKLSIPHIIYRKISLKAVFQSEKCQVHQWKSNRFMKIFFSTFTPGLYEKESIGVFIPPKILDNPYYSLPPFFARNFFWLISN